MRQNVSPARDPIFQELVAPTIKPLTLSSNCPRQLVITQSDNLGIESAAKDPGFCVGRPTSLKNEIIEEYAARAKTLIPRKQTTKSFKLCRILRIETSDRGE